jgi:hypothetical protein
VRRDAGPTFTQHEQAVAHTPHEVVRGRCRCPVVTPERIGAGWVPRRPARASCSPYLVSFLPRPSLRRYGAARTGLAERGSNRSTRSRVWATRSSSCTQHPHLRHNPSYPPSRQDQGCITRRRAASPASLLGRAELAAGTARALGRQRRAAAGGQRPTPPVGRHPGHPAPGRHLPVAGALLEPLPRRQPDPLLTGPLLGGQPTTVGIPQASGIARPAPTVSRARNVHR